MEAQTLNHKPCRRKVGVPAAGAAGARGAVAKFSAGLKRKPKPGIPNPAGARSAFQLLEQQVHEELWQHAQHARGVQVTHCPLVSIRIHQSRPASERSRLRRHRHHCGGLSCCEAACAGTRDAACHCEVYAKRVSSQHRKVVRLPMTAGRLLPTRLFLAAHTYITEAMQLRGAAQRHISFRRRNEFFFTRTPFVISSSSRCWRVDGKSCCRLRS